MIQNDDTISRQAAIDALKGLPTWWADEGGYYGGARPPMVALLDPEDAVSAIENLPSAQQDCTDCPEYDTERHYCPKYCDVIRRTLEEAKQERTGRWIYDENDFMTKCSECDCHPWFGVIPTPKEATKKLPHCPMCLAKMEGES